MASGCHIIILVIDIIKIVKCTLHVNGKCSINEGLLGKQCTDTEAFVTLNKESINK